MLGRQTTTSKHLSGKDPQNRQVKVNVVDKVIASGSLGSVTRQISPEKMSGRDHS